MNTPTIKTNRLILRKFTPNDITAIYKIYGDKEVNTFLPWYPVKNMQEAEEFFKKRIASVYTAKQCYAYAICLKENNVPIGYVNVNGDDSHDLGYGLRKEFWHRGIVTEACQAVIDQLKKDGLSYITATHDVKNDKSGRVMQRLGMKYQYSYKEQWQPKNILVTFRMYQLNLDGNWDRVYRKYWDQSEIHFVEKLMGE